jgi:hypothetical protein
MSILLKLSNSLQVTTKVISHDSYGIFPKYLA